MTCLWHDCPEAQQKFGSRRGINLLGVGRVCKCNLCGVTLFKSRLRVVTREPEATTFLEPQELQSGRLVSRLRLGTVDNQLSKRQVYREKSKGTHE